MSLTGREWRSIALMAAVVIALHAIGFFILIVLVAPHHYRLGSSGAFTMGLGLTAYTLVVLAPGTSDELRSQAVNSVVRPTSSVQCPIAMP